MDGGTSKEAKKQPRLISRPQWRLGGPSTPLVDEDGNVIGRRTSYYKERPKRRPNPYLVQVMYVDKMKNGEVKISKEDHIAGPGPVFRSEDIVYSDTYYAAKRMSRLQI